MLQNQPKTTPLFQTSLRSWRENYLARQQARAALAGETAEPIPPAEQAAPASRVKRLAPRRRRRQAAAAEA